MAVLAGKVALVTAATDGIGLAVALALGAAGARVVLSSRRAPRVEAAVGQLRGRGLEATGVVCHVGRPQDRQRLVQTIFQVNVTAAAMLVRLVVPHMERRGGGAIVLVSSLAGYMPFPALGPYSVSKAALLGLLKALAPELRPRGIRINAVAPGLIRTRFSAALWEDEERRQAVMSSMGIDRLGTPSDVASVVTFLCSPAASYVVGETVVVAGGAPSRL
ncbi:dehydrogenase/reductase SDR family member 4-like isoform X2 [Anas platyrhynchos]|uniref:dehydrogenase/reductase SDR family member 4-like isoform X2 n=1 Tax=Anas platyrhynchos TaxID=8839 RepID=UPI003AF261C3